MTWFCWFLLAGWLVTAAMLVWAQHKWGQALTAWRETQEMLAAAQDGLALALAALKNGARS